LYAAEAGPRIAGAVRRASEEGALCTFCPAPRRHGLWVLPLEAPCPGGAPGRPGSPWV